MFSLTSQRAGPAPDDGGKTLSVVAPEPRGWADNSAPTREQDMQRLFYRWSGQFSAVLIRTRARFDGDLDQYVLYLTFLLSELADRINGEAGAPRQQRGLNALSLSEITGIPRESARRKLLLLAANGYLNRDSDGLFTLADRYGLDSFFEELKPLFADAIAPRA